MFHLKPFAVLTISLMAAACSSSYERQVLSPQAASYGPTIAERNCIEEGYPSGSVGLGQCVQRQVGLRRSEAVSYDESNVVNDARNACLSYGLNPAMVGFDRCVTHQVDGRRPTTYVGESYSVRYVEAGYSYDGGGNRIDAQGSPIDPYGHRYIGANNYRPGPGDYGQPPAANAYSR
jgi:hypothetical protein